VIAAWAERYLEQPVNRSDEQIEVGTVLVRETGNGKFQQEITSGRTDFLLTNLSRSAGSTPDRALTI
jgi:hypothetical protein